MMLDELPNGPHRRLLKVGNFAYAVLSLGERRSWRWEVYPPGQAVEQPIRTGTFKGSEARAHMVAREAIACLREQRFACG